MKRRDYPVIIGHKYRKGIFAFRNLMFGGGGFDLAIVRLKRQYESGEPFDLADMDGAEVILHFCDREALQLTADVINRVLKNWKDG